MDKFLSNWAQDNYENFQTGAANRKRTQSYTVKLLLRKLTERINLHTVLNVEVISYFKLNKILILIQCNNGLIACNFMYDKTSYVCIILFIIVFVLNAELLGTFYNVEIS